MRIPLTLPLCVVSLVACQRSAGSRSAAPYGTTAVCYQLTFDGARPVIAPERMALLPGDGGGLAVWLPSANQTEGRYVMVGQRGRWRTNADSLVVEFHTPRILSDILLHGTGDTLRGRVGSMTDGAIGVWGWETASARPIRCPASTAAASFPAG